MTQESIASEAASYALSSDDISGCISEVDSFIKGLSNHSILLNGGSTLTIEVRSYVEPFTLHIMTNAVIS